MRVNGGEGMTEIIESRRQKTMLVPKHKLLYLHKNITLMLCLSAVHLLEQSFIAD